jgi:hypothetical protein
MSSQGDNAVPLGFAGDYLPVGPVRIPTSLRAVRLIANLECVITQGAATGGKAHSVVLPHQAIEHVVASPFAALSVANNHVLDAGKPALDAMLRLLDANSDAQIYGTLQQPFAEFTVGDARSAVIGCIERCRSRGRVLFREEHAEQLIRELSGSYSRIYVTPHWGKEGEFAFHPSPRQRRLARRWIEAGAAGVFGHHPHVIHGREIVSGSPVYYSLGNLYFPHEESSRYPATRLGLLAIVTHEGAPGDVEERFIDTSDVDLLLIDENADSLRRWLDRLSDDLTDGTWSRTRWLRKVGPTYITKSDRSWRRRLTEHRDVRTRLLNLIWNCAPTTLLMRFGRRFPLGEGGNSVDAILQKLSRAEHTKN